MTGVARLVIRIVVLVAVLMLAAVSPAAAGERTVVAYGNLWMLDAAGDVVRVSPAGQRDVFDAPGGRKVEALAVDRTTGSGRLWLTAQDGASVVLHSLASDGTFGAPVDLGFPYTVDPYYPLRDLTVSSDGDVWVGRGWSPCDPGSGDIYRYRPSTASISRIVVPAYRDGKPAYLNSRLVADRFGRVFMSLTRNERAAYDTCEGPGDRVFQGASGIGAFFTLDGAVHSYEHGGDAEPVPCTGGLGRSPFAADARGTVWCTNSSIVDRFDAEYINWWNYNLPTGIRIEEPLGAAGADELWVRWYRSPAGGGAVTQLHIGSLGLDGALRTFPELDDIVSLPVPDDPGWEVRTEFEIAPDGTYWVLRPEEDGSYTVIRTGRLGAGETVLKVEPFTRDMFFSCSRCTPTNGGSGTFTVPNPEQWLPTHTSTQGPQARVTVSLVKLARRSLTVRASAATTFKARIQRRRGRRWVTVRTVTVRTTRAGKAAKASLRAIPRRRYRVVLTTGSTKIIRTVTSTR